MADADLARLAFWAWDAEEFYDQTCKHGCRVDTHAVYCENTDWADAPRKCRRTWYTGGEVRDEDCPGFAPNDRAQPVTPAGGGG